MSPAAFLSTSLGHAQPAAQCGDQDDDQNDHADQDHDFLLRMNKTPLQSTGFSSHKRLLKLHVNPKQKSCSNGLTGPPKHKHKLPHFKKKRTSCSSNIYRTNQT
uniref:Putative secreted protein n=1 Tax=Ixodes ricinus TaxID=34613 RepID=A0A6B0U8B2_IXORI